MRHLLSTIGITALLVSSASGQENTANLSAEQMAVKANAELFVDAFNKADPDAIAALFTSNGQMSVDGETIAEGRKAIEKVYADYFTANPDTTISVTIDSLKVLGPNLVIEKGTSQLTSSDEPVVDAYTAVHVKQDGKWLTATADVVQRPALPDFDWKQELEFLVGQWRSEDHGWRVDTSVEWIAGGNFLKRSFKVHNGDGLKSSGIQVIGWDAGEGTITSWVFSSDGGHGRGWWTRDGDHWVIESEGTTADGDALHATNIITLLGKDQFRWQSTDRFVNGVEIEDTPSIRVQRANGAK